MFKVLILFIAIPISFISFILKKKLIFFNLLSEKFENKLYLEKKILNENFKFYCPNRLIEWRINNFFSKEIETIEWIDSFKGNDIIFWDIGANIGNYSIYAAAKHKKNIKIFSFEPSTSNLRTLSRNISINNLNNTISIIPIALGENFSINSMNESIFKEGSALHSFSKNYDYRGKNFQIKNIYNTLGISINKLIFNKILPIPNYIKLDVDGIEHLILQNANILFKKNKTKEILVELNPSFKLQFNIVKKIMKKNNFYLKNKINKLGEYIFVSK